MKKLLTIFLALVMLVLTGCNGATTSSEQTQSKTDVTSSNTQTTKEKALSIACSVTDSFCPYTAKTLMNRNISTLLYDSLVVLDNNFNPKNSLASEVTVKGKTVTVTLNSISFSDGSSLTADDVVYCAKKAMKSSTRYDFALEDVESVSAASKSTVVFKLSKEDPYFKNQLDFPVYKANSETKLSGDNIEIPPIGSGRYIINEEKTQLEVNPNYWGKKPQIKKINLINTPDNDSLLHNLEFGNITYHYSDLSDSILKQVRGNYKRVNTTNIVYIGANMQTGAMAYGEVRQAVSAIINRDRVVNEAYYQNAVATTSIFNPEWQEAENLVTLSSSINKNVYLAQLEKIGYNKKDNKGYYVNSKGERLTLKLVNYKGNKWRTNAAELISAQLKAEGIKVVTDNLSWNEYKSALKNGHFDIYIAEVKLGNNMDIGELVTKGGEAAYGIYYKKTSKPKKSTSSDTTSTGEESGVEIAEAGSTAEAVKGFYKGEKTLLEVSAAFYGEMPIIPICYRTGISSFSGSMSGIKPSQSDIYLGIENIREE